ncbi:MAG: D-2-hydroxyacid dehydrogenase [Azonexus sp.]|nr:D-2-hydroxyacid dehydrogenase [Azonexus sp.]MCK6411214.1 D-2-hydroxyacid dehydrogenase [Azonexus sp.]
MWRIVNLDAAGLPVELPLPGFEHQWVSHAATAADEVLARLQGAQIAVTNKVPLSAATVDALPELKMIAIAATGANHIDLAACRARGIVVSNIRGYAEHTVPEHVLSLILALLRNLVAWRQTLQAGAWSQASQFCLFEHPIRDLHGSTLALVGSGSLGQGVARLATAFGMRVLQVERKGLATPRPGYVSFAQALAEADVLSLHCPLTPETRHLIGEAELRAMRRDALLINTARGGIVDELALARALREGWIGGAGFDVLSSEPPPADHPLLAPDLLALPNFILTPHVAWSSRPAMQALATQLIGNIEAFVAGTPRNCL